MSLRNVYLFVRQLQVTDKVWLISEIFVHICCLVYTLAWIKQWQQMNPIWILHFLKSIFHCFSSLHPKLINYLPRGDSWLPKWYEPLCKDVIFACVQWTTSDCSLFGDVTRELGWFVIVEVDHSVVFIATSQVAFFFNSQFQLTNAAPVSLCLGTQQGLVWIGLWLVT